MRKAGGEDEEREVTPARGAGGARKGSWKGPGPPRRHSWVGGQLCADPARVTRGPGRAGSHLPSHLALKEKHSRFHLIIVLPGDPGANVAFLRETQSSLGFRCRHALNAHVCSMPAHCAHVCRPHAASCAPTSWLWGRGWHFSPTSARLCSDCPGQRLRSRWAPLSYLDQSRSAAPTHLLKMARLSSSSPVELLRPCRPSLISLCREKSTQRIKIPKARRDTANVLTKALQS